MSLLISVVLFAGFAYLAFTGLFDLVETRFYNPSITRSLNQEIRLDAETIQDFLTGLQARFAAALMDNAVRRSFLTNQSVEDIRDRSQLYGSLQEEFSGLQMVRFIDAGGSRIHYSTYGADILRESSAAIAYRNYGEAEQHIPYETIAVAAGENPKITLDAAEERILLSFPFTDSYEVYRGTALFSLSVRAVMERLINEGRITVGENVSILDDPPGIVSGVPAAEKAVLIPIISSIWGEGILTLTTLDSASGTSAALISSKTSQGIYIGRLVDESVFQFPLTMKIILLVSIYLTLYLTIFLLFNLRQDSMTVIQNRLKQLQLTLIEEYYDRKSDMDWSRWRWELDQRREAVRTELKRGIKEKAGKESGIDLFIDKSWDELLSVIGGRERITAAGIDEAKLQKILSRLLTNTSIAALPPAQVRGAEPASGAEAVEELEELDETGTVEPAETAEAVEELEELDETGTVKPAETAEAVEKPGAAAKTAEDQKPSNLKLVFGDDDIPTIVETSGLELVDEDIDSVMNIMRSDEEVGELEELEPEELEAIGEFPAPAPAAAPSSLADDLASQIEFSDLDDEDEDTGSFDMNIEIVSPFSRDREPDQAVVPQGSNKALKLEELEPNYEMSLVYKPFSATDTSPGILENEGGNSLEAVKAESIIEERDGVHYINESALDFTAGNETKLDQDFKNLINSVLKK
ncbi:MAG: hypothetical protein LBO80_00030 [Treponema sp.]|nr:hypothetical protein [Treponema sp.]